jgi:LPS-assembly protein
VRVFLTKLICLFLLLFNLSAQGAKTPVTSGSVFVDADNYVSHSDQSADLEGHVTLVRGLQQITCDKAHVNLKTNDVKASGNVIVITPKDFIKAEHADFNFNTQKGIIYNGFIQTGQETIEGKVIYKLGENNYSATDATYTSCVNCPPSWKLSGTNIDATVGSYAYITNPVVRLYSVPVLWLPYMIIPIKTERQSGLLTPNFGFGATNGFTISESYFWAIDKSRDSTFTLTDYKNRGIKGGLEYRYFADKFSRGTFNGNIIGDKIYGNDSKYLNTDGRYVTGSRIAQFQIARYGVHYDHHYLLPDGFVQNTNINLASDTAYVYDFPSDIGNVGEIALENRASLAKNTENSHSGLDVDVYQNLLKADPTGQDNQTVHRVPEFEYALMPKHILGTNLLASVDASYLNLARSSRGFDIPWNAPPNQTMFVTGAAGYNYRTGQRLLIHPDLTYPINIGKVLDLVPEVDYTEEDYSFGYSDKPTTSRRFFRTSMQAKTRFSSVFGEDDPKGEHHKYKHEIEPALTYTYVPYLSQEEHQFFGSSEFAFVPHYAAAQPITEYDDLQFDYRDKLSDKNLVTFGITNKWIRKSVPGPGSTTTGSSDYSKENYNPDLTKNQTQKPQSTSYQEIIRHTLSQSYDIDNANEPTSQRIKNFQTGGYVLDPIAQQPVLVANPKQPWSEIRSLLEVKLSKFGFISDVSYYPYQSAATDSSTVILRDRRGDAISGSYVQSFVIQSPTTATAATIGSGPQTNLVTSRSDAASIKAFITTKYLDAAISASYDILVQKITSTSLNTLIKPPGKCWGFNLYVSQQLDQKPSWTITLPIYFGEGKSFSVGKPQGL